METLNAYQLFLFHCILHIETCVLCYSFNDSSYYGQITFAKDVFYSATPYALLKYMLCYLVHYNENVYAHRLAETHRLVHKLTKLLNCTNKLKQTHMHAKTFDTPTDSRYEEEFFLTDRNSD